MFAPGEKGKGTLHVNIHQAKELPRMDPNGLTDGVIKCHLLPDKSIKGKRKTGVIKNNLNPVWEEKFTYEKVTLEELSKERVLEVCVCHNDPKGNNVVIGGVRLGLAPGAASKHKEWMDSIGDEVSHWEAMLAHPGEWVDRWHTLRHTMEPRSVDLSVSPSGSTSSFQQPFHKEGAVPSKVEEQSTKMEVVVGTSVPLQTSNQEMTSKEHPNFEPTEDVKLGSQHSSKPTPKEVLQPPAPMQMTPESVPKEVTPSVLVKTEPSPKEVTPSVQVKTEPSSKEVTPSVQVKTEPSPKEVTPSVQVKTEPSPKEVTPSVLVKTEPSPKEVTPSVQVKTEPSPKEVTPSVQVKTEPSHKEVTPSVQVKTEPSPKEVTPSVQVKTEPSPKEVTPSVLVKTESSPKEVTPSVQAKTEPSPKEVTPSVLVKTEPSPKEVTPSVQVKTEPSLKEVSQPVLPNEPEFKRLSKHIQAEIEVLFTITHKHTPLCIALHKRHTCTDSIVHVQGVPNQGKY